MPKEKYNWPELKLEYMESDFLEVKTFFKHKFGVFTRPMSGASTGWNGEKKLREKNKTARTLEIMAEKDAQEMASALTSMRGYYKDKVKKKSELDKMDAYEAEKVWKVLRVENNLPVNITHQTNVNKVADPEDAADKLQDESID